MQVLGLSLSLPFLSRPKKGISISYLVGSYDLRKTKFVSFIFVLLATSGFNIIMKNRRRLWLGAWRSFAYIGGWT